MKKVSELYLVACQADTFAEAVDSACSDVIAMLGEEGEATKFEMVSLISEFALMARALRQTSSAAIKRHKEGGGYTNSDVLEAIEWAREAGWSPSDEEGEGNAVPTNN